MVLAMVTTEMAIGMAVNLALGGPLALPAYINQLGELERDLIIHNNLALRMIHLRIGMIWVAQRIRYVLQSRN